MRFASICLVASFLVVTSASAAPANTKPRRVKAPVATKSKLSTMSIDSERATQIQTALIGAGYLSGTPTGSWDATSIAAMGKFQGDNGWQTKIVPDSRAIIKLGLGSSYTAATHLAGATTATTAAPSEPTPAGIEATTAASN